MLSNAEVAWTAFENERLASSWALRSMAAHVQRVEDDLAIEVDARQRAELRVRRLEDDLRSAGRDPADPVSGVRLKGAPA